MRRELFAVLLLLAISLSTFAQQTIYWKKDHVYAGPGGPEIATLTPVPSDQTAPTTPTGVTTSNVTSTSVQINWSAVTDSGGSGLAGYKVYRRLQSGGAILPVGTVATDTLSFVDQGPLTPATGYTYRVRAFDKAQNHSELSSGANATTSGVTDTTAPATPTGLTGYLLTRNSVRLTWNRSIDTGGSGISGYKVYRGGNLISGGTPIATPTFDDTGLAYKTSYAYTITAVDVANNASAATSAFNITTDRELLVQDNFNRGDGALGSPWTASIGSPTYLVANFTGCGGMYEPYCWDLLGTTPTAIGGLTLASIRAAAAGSYPTLPSYTGPFELGMEPYEFWSIGTWNPLVWSHAAMQPSTNSFKASIDVVTSNSMAGIFFYAQSATGTGANHGLGTYTYASSRGFRAVLQNGSVILQNCSDLNYLDSQSSVCSTVASVGSVPSTGTIAVETNSATGNVKVSVNGVLKIDTTVSTGLMSGAIGPASLGYFDYDQYGVPTTYHTATLDNFILERN